MSKKSKKEEELESRIKELEQTIEHLNKLISEKDAWISYLQNQVIIKLDEIRIAQYKCDHAWQFNYSTTVPYKTCVKCNITEYVRFNEISSSTTSPTFQLIK